MKKTAFAILLMLACTASRADTYKYLVFSTTAGEDIAMTAEGMKITFSDGNLVADNGTETRTMALSELSHFCFSDTTTGISAATAERTAEAAEVYNVSGQRVGTVCGGGTLSLPRGTYILKSGDGTKKLVVK